jgi:hypothetical protein
MSLKAWLAARLQGVPESLRARIEEAVARPAARLDAPGGGVEMASALARAGTELLARAKAMPPSRDAALTLLAADALMTYACEALAEQAPERLGELR